MVKIDTKKILYSRDPSQIASEVRIAVEAFKAQGGLEEGVDNAWSALTSIANSAHSALMFLRYGGAFSEHYSCAPVVNPIPRSPSRKLQLLNNEAYILALPAYQLRESLLVSR